jgi:hypothetical protein
MTVLWALPLIFAGLDELLFRRQQPTRLVGAALALVVIWQFFVSTEILVIAGLVAAVSPLSFLLWARFVLCVT